MITHHEIGLEVKQALAGCWLAVFEVTDRQIWQAKHRRGNAHVKM